MKGTENDPGMESGNAASQAEAGHETNTINHERRSADAAQLQF